MVHRVGLNTVVNIKITTPSGKRTLAIQSAANHFYGWAVTDQQTVLVPQLLNNVYRTNSLTFKSIILVTSDSYPISKSSKTS